LNGNLSLTFFWFYSCRADKRIKHCVIKEDGRLFTVGLNKLKHWSIWWTFMRNIHSTIESRWRFQLQTSWFVAWGL
jgi:hypothetical protein